MITIERQLPYYIWLHVLDGLSHDLHRQGALCGLWSFFWLVNGKARDGDMESQNVLSTVLGDQLAFCDKVITQLEDEGVYPCYWSLHVRNISFYLSFKILIRVSKRTCVLGERHDLLEIRFLIRERLPTLTSRTKIERYDVEDLSNAPSLQAKFILPELCPSCGTRRTLDLDNKPTESSHVR